MKVNKIIYSILILVFTATLFGCSYKPDPDSPGFEFAPNMYHAVSYHPLKQYKEEPHFYNPHGMNMREPVPGTIARGQLDYYYPYQNDNEGYEAAGRELRNPLERTEKNILEGKRLYSINCAICHGEKGLGDGNVITKASGDGLFPPPPPFNEGRLKDLPVGQMYHTITFGRNLMGSHASHLSPEERWKVIHYIDQFRGNTEIVSSNDEEETDENDTETDNNEGDTDNIDEENN